MKESKSSLLLYITYKYFFASMIVLMVLGTTKEFIINGEHRGDVKEFRELMILVAVFFLCQIIAHRFVFRATVNKEQIVFNNGQAINWDNIKFVNRLHHLYILKTKDKKRYYLFPVERQPIRLFGDRVEYTDMDQIINLKRV